MGNQTLFEALTGYAAPAVDETGPQLLGAGSEAGDGEPAESDFPDIIEALHATAATDPPARPCSAYRLT
jgi:hypothetical protein